MIIPEDIITDPQTIKITISLSCKAMVAFMNDESFEKLVAYGSPFTRESRFTLDVYADKEMVTYLKLKYDNT